MDALEEIRGRLEAATPGPWKAKHRPDLPVENDPDILAKERNEMGGQVGSAIHNGDPSNPLWGSVWPNRNAAKNAEFIAHAPTDMARLLAALEAVLALHKPVTVYELDPLNGTWVYDESDERKVMSVLCSECTPDPIIEEIDESEYDGPNDIDVDFPCPTVKAVQAALGGAA